MRAATDAGNSLTTLAHDSSYAGYNKQYYRCIAHRMCGCGVWQRQSCAEGPKVRNWHSNVKVIFFFTRKSRRGIQSNSSWAHLILLRTETYGKALPTIFHEAEANHATWVCLRIRIPCHSLPLPCANFCELKKLSYHFCFFFFIWLTGNGAYILACLYDRCCHIGSVEGLTRLWNVITFKRAKNTESKRRA